MQPGERELMCVSLSIGHEVTLDREVSAVVRKQCKETIPPPFRNATPPLFKDGNGAHYNTVCGETQTDIREEDPETPGKYKWKKDPSCPRSKVWIVYVPCA